MTNADPDNEISSSTNEDPDRDPTYVTQGKIKIKVEAGGSQPKLTITPASEYSVKHKTKVYTVFVQDDCSSPCKCKCECKCKCFKDVKEFIVGDTLPAELKSSLVKAAFEQTLLQITINSTDAIVGIQVPA